MNNTQPAVKTWKFALKPDRDGVNSSPMTIGPDALLAAIAKIEKLYPVPRTLGRALSLLRDPHADLDDIAPLIGYDTSLTAHIIRSANSAFYATAERAKTVNEAVQIIGFRETIRLVSLVVAQTTSHRYLACYGIQGEDFWAESVFNGLFLQRLTRLTVSCDPEEAYTAGLLRFVGRLAIDQAVEDLGVELLWDRKMSIDAWEKQTVGVTQSFAGAHLLRAWQFSEEFVEAIERQDDPAAAALPNPLAQAIQFTATLFPAGLNRAYFETIDEKTLDVSPQTPFVQEHQLSPEMIAAVLTESHNAFREVTKSLAT